MSKYNLTESHDLDVLNDPAGTITDRGGYIYLASDEKDYWYCSFNKEHNDEFELAKMTVDPQYGGRGISKLLMEKCLDKANEIGVKNYFFIQQPVTNSN